MTRPLLVPLDGSERGEAALPWATHLARTHRLPVALVQIVRGPMLTTGGMLGGALTPSMYDQLLAEERGAAAAYLEGVAGRLVADGIETQSIVRDGEPAESILDVADELNAIAIVVATHGRGGLARLVMGSVTERILRQATIPVLVARAARDGVAPAPSLKRLLVPLDGSFLAEQALDIAKQIADRDATLVLTRVVAPVRRTMSGTEGAITIDDEAATRAALAEASAYLARVAGELERPGLSVEHGARIGDPRAELLGAAHEHRADLIVMSTHGHTGPARWMLGSVADQVVRHADCPVLLVSARALAARAVSPFAVRDAMTRDLAVVLEDEPLAVVVRKLLRRRVSGAPVVNADGELVGVVSERDLLDWQAGLAKTLTTGTAEQSAPTLESTPVREIMSRPAISVEESAPLATAIGLLRGRIRRLPVTREGKLVGMLTRRDVLKAMAAESQPEGAEPRHAAP